MPVTGYSGTALTTATTFNGSFGVLSSISSTDTTKLEYTAVSGTVEGSTDAYTATVNGSETNGIYYHFYIDYMITATKSLKVTAAAKAYSDATTTTEVATDKPSIAQATRVGIIPAASVTTDDTSKQMTGATYATTGQEYTVAAPAGTDYNYEELKALGYTGDSEYKENLGDLYSSTSNVTFNPASLNATTSDGAFAYGSLSIYVWFDGTDKSCTNAIFSQTLDLTLTFAVAD